MNQTESVIQFFDERADGWLAMEQNASRALQPAVARMAGVFEGSRVLDIGCGLGAMAQTYLDAKAEYVLGVDISPKMITLASKRWEHEPSLEFVAADASTLSFSDEECFDAVVIYNAYPHFFNRSALVSACAAALKPGGRFVVAHSTGKEGINAHHDAHAAGVSLGLEDACQEAQAWQGSFAIDGVVDTPGFYAFCGSK